MSRKEKKTAPPQENIIKIGEAFQILNGYKFHSASKWYLLEKYAQWLTIQKAIDKLYHEKPQNWISERNKLTLAKHTAMHNIILLAKDLYTGNEDCRQNGSSYIMLLNNLFGEGGWG